MRIIFNGREEELPEEIPLGDYLAAKGYRNELLVVQHNGQIYRPGEWQRLIIKPGDQLDVLHFVGGG
ncbi:MAG: sulfur carrier protein ThiS [Smithellaceae bacterium]|nr:sulfur carrier protein ThiS [Smithellaceae bacterium]